jgi:hypothetical protein
VYKAGGRWLAVALPPQVFKTQSNKVWFQKAAAAACPTHSLPVGLGEGMVGLAGALCSRVQ